MHTTALASALTTALTTGLTVQRALRRAAALSPSPSAPTAVRSLATIAPSAAAASPTKSKDKAASAAPVSTTSSAAATTDAPAPSPTAGGRHTRLRNPRFHAPAVKDAQLNWEAVGEPVCEIMINGYVKQQVLFFSQFAQRTIQHLGMPLEGPITVSPHVRRWTVLTSPFKYKKFQETFERKTFKRRLTIYAASNDAVDKCLHYLSEMTPAGVGLRVVRYERETPGVSERMKKAAEDILAKGGNVELPLHVYLPKRDMYEVLAENAKVRLGAKKKPVEKAEEVVVVEASKEAESAAAAPVSEGKSPSGKEAKA